jgi:galactonate dehydratase
MKIANTAEAFEVNIAPHNFSGHLATMMNAHFAAAAPNLRIMEIDIDRLAWDEEVFTVAPRFENGHLVVPATSSWGTEPHRGGDQGAPAQGTRWLAALPAAVIGTPGPQIILGLRFP